MENLVTIEHNQPFTTSLAIAEGLGLQHASVIRLIRKYQSDFEDENLVRFEIQARLKGQWGGGATEIAILDEEQATLLMTYLRNTEKVRLFKKSLVKAFFRAKSLLMTGQMGLLQAQAILYATKEQEKANASMHGKGLADWKKKRDALDLAIQQVEHQLQPQLTHFDQALANH